jgi:hypothetical protein
MSTIEMLPIAEAPVRHGEYESFGPCLLIELDGAWVIGRWSETSWWDEEGGRQITPTHYALLPVTAADPFALARASC